MRLKKRVDNLELGELQDLKIFLSLSKKIKENESVISSLMENINLILDHLKFVHIFTGTGVKPLFQFNYIILLK